MGSITPIPSQHAFSVTTPLYQRMCEAIAECVQVDEAKDIRDKTAALEAYYRQAKNTEAEHAAANVRLRAERRGGELLKDVEREQGKRVDTSSHEGTRSALATTLSRLGLSKQDASRWQRLAAIPEPEFEAALSKPEKPTTRGLIDKPAHRVDFTGENEWYTPAHVLDCARQALGGIDLDPASHPFAQETVQADRYFTADDDGLAHRWGGRVWLNPPYSQPLISQFVDKLIAEVGARRVEQAIMLVNNCTDAGWFIRAANAADALGFTCGRIRFISRLEGVASSPPQGQAYFYYGANPERFVAAFADVAWFPPGTPGCA